MYAAYSKHTERRAQAILAERRRIQNERIRLEQDKAAEAKLAVERAKREAWEAEARVLEEYRENAALIRVEREEVRLEAKLPYRPTYKELERRTCKLFKVTPSELKSQRRHKDISFARHFLMYWTARLTSLSLPQIGRMLGNRDHTTILHGKNVYPIKRAKMKKGRHLRVVR